MPSHQWARDFLVTDDDVETLTGLLLEREIPLSIDELARTLIEQRLEQQKAAAQERFKDVHVYRPSDSYEVGQTVMFPAFDHATAKVIEQRAGDNADYGDFNVIQVEFEDDTVREFADRFQRRAPSQRPTPPRRCSPESPTSTPTRFSTKTAT